MHDDDIIAKYAALYAAAGNNLNFTHDDDYTVVENKGWEQDHKYQLRETIVRFEGVYLSVCESRAGSPFSDWDYGDTFIAPVEARQVTVTSWEHTGNQVTVPARY